MTSGRPHSGDWPRRSTTDRADYRLIAQYRDTQSLKPLDRASRTSFARKYSSEDVTLLAETDSLHNTLSGPATKVLLIRAFATFGDSRFARLSQISVSHLYNLRASDPYRKQRPVWQRTRPSPVAIGIRKAPAPQGLPGYIRIDTVHQGDQDGLKGVYHINRRRYRHPVGTGGLCGAH